MVKFEEFFKELKKGARKVAKKEAAKFTQAATDDGKDFLEAIKIDLGTWTNQLAQGKLSPENFAFLVRGKKDLAQMKALTQAGLAAIRIDRVRMAMIDLIITAAGKLV